MMTGRLGWLSVVFALACSGAVAADGLGALADVPVADSARVAASEYRKATALAARGGRPIDVALAVAGAFEGKIQHVIQANEGAETSSASHVTVLRDGLPDDSVRGERWDIALERTAAETWRIREVRRAWRCWRGGQKESFSASRCP